jgi:glycogen debranching enzyme
MDNKKPANTEVQTSKDFLALLKNHIDLTVVPFSDRGSRLLIYQSRKHKGFYIKLAERLSFLDSQIEAYLKRPPFIDDLYLVDGNGKRLNFEITSHPHMLQMKTDIGEFAIVFQDERTISIGLPAKQKAGIHFHATPQQWKINGQGGKFKAIRNLSYQSNAEILLNEMKPMKGGYAVDFIVKSDQDCAITLSIDEKHLSEEVAPFSQSAAFAETRWKTWFEKVPPVDAKFDRSYAYAWWVMANNLISPRGNVAYEAMTPSKTNYIGLWLWDSAMHALAYRHIDPILARNQIRAMLAYQLPDGMLPDAIYDEGVISEIDHPFKAEVTKPPILAWAAMKLHEKDPDVDFLREIYIPLVRWNAWWFNMNDDNVDGLAQYNHPYSSGLDNNPLWDYGMPVESPDLNTYLCVQMGSLAMIAEVLGMQNEAEMWRRRSGAIVKRMIKEFWEEESGFFRAFHGEQPIPVLTPFNLYPLWSGQLPDDIKSKLLIHLKEGNEFWGKYPIPSVARNDKHYDPAVMWRGPVWVNINYFFIEALQQVGEHQLAGDLREKTLNMIMAQDGMFEFYNAENGQPGTNAAAIFGWTAAVFIDLAIQENNEKLKE